MVDLEMTEIEMPESEIKRLEIESEIKRLEIESKIERMRSALDLEERALYGLLLKFHRLGLLPKNQIELRKAVAERALLLEQKEQRRKRKKEIEAAMAAASRGQKGKSKNYYI